MTDFNTHMKEEFNPFIERIKKYLASEHGLRENEEFYFFMDLQYEAPFYQGNLKKLTKDELNTNYFLSDLDEICEMAEPFTNCEKENKLLLELMKKYGYM